MSFLTTLLRRERRDQHRREAHASAHEELRVKDATRAKQDEIAARLEAIEIEEELRTRRAKDDDQ